MSWHRPLRTKRCRAYLHPHDSPYHGRCDKERGHRGAHALERGMDTVYFTIDVVTAHEAWKSEERDG